MSERDQNYLKDELYALIQTDPTIFEFLQAGSLDGIWYWDLGDQAQEWMSPRFWETFGYDPAEKEHLASEWQGMIHPEDLALAIENVQKHIADPDYPYDQVVRYTHQDGSTVWVRCRGLVIRDADGAPRRMLGAHTDITALKQAEEALVEKVLDLQNYTRILSHDFKPPLRQLHGFSALLAEELGEDLSDDAKMYLSVIQSSVLRMDALMTSVLSLARASSAALSRETFPLKLAADAALAALAVEESGAVITWDPLPEVEGDLTLLTQLFQNLIGNALKYTESDAPGIAITAEETDSGWIFGVRDDGIGVEPRFAERVFEPFERLHGRERYPGSGVGLSICSRVVARHGGRIWVESEAGQGAHFKFTLK